MTKRKAIDRALRALPLSNHSFYREVLENLWTEARIAGLREAAMMAKGEMGFGDVKILKVANALAKKARAK